MTHLHPALSRSQSRRLCGQFAKDEVAAALHLSLTQLPCPFSIDLMTFERPWANSTSPMSVVSTSLGHPCRDSWVQLLRCCGEFGLRQCRSYQAPGSRPTQEIGCVVACCDGLEQGLLVPHASAILGRGRGGGVQVCRRDFDRGPRGAMWSRHVPRAPSRAKNVIFVGPGKLSRPSTPH